MGQPVEVQIFLAAPFKLYMKKSYRPKPNPKVIALLIEIGLMISGAVFLMVWYSLGKTLVFWPTIVISVVLLFALIITLNLIRYDAIRAIRSEHYINKEKKNVFLTLYSDQTTNICHDLIDESRDEHNYE